MMPFNPKLSGVEIANVRIHASRSQLGSSKRKNRKLPHVGKKQLAKIAARSE